MIDLHIYLVPSEMWRDKYNNMDNEDVSESISLGFIRIHPESRVYDLREEIEIQLNSPNLPQEYVFLKSVGRCLTKVKHHQELRLKAKHFLPQLNSSQKYGNEVYIIETSIRGSDSSTSNSILMSSDQRNSSNNGHVTGGKFRYQNGNSKPRNGNNYHLPFLQTSEKLQRLVRVGPPHQNLKHINPTPLDPSSNSNSDSYLGSPTYQMGSKLVDDSNYYLEEVAMGTKLHTPPSLSLSPTNHNNRRRRRQRRIPARSVARSDPVSKNVAGNDDDDDDDNDDDDDDDDVLPTIHSYSEPPYFSHPHFRSPYVHSYPYLINDMVMLPVSRSPRNSKRRARNNNNNNNNNDDNKDYDDNNSNDNGETRQSRSPNTGASFPGDLSQRSTRRSKEKPKAEGNVTSDRRTMTDGKEEEDEDLHNPTDEKRLREMRAREELKREQEEQERWERLDSEQQNFELGLTKGAQEKLRQQDGVSDGEGPGEEQREERLSPRKKKKAETGKGKEQGEEGEEEGEGEDNEKGEDGEEKAEEVKGEVAEDGVGNEEQDEEAELVEQNTERDSRNENSIRPEPNTETTTSKKEQSLSPAQKTAEPENARSKQKNETEKLQEMLESIREQRKSKERQREELVKRAKSLQAKIQNRRNHARDIWKKKYYEEKKKTSPLEEQCNKQRHELDVIHRKYISSLEPAKEKPTKITTKKPSEKNNILIQASRLKHETEDLQHRVDNAKMKLTAELKLRNQTEIELKALKGELIQQKINLNLIRKQQLSSIMTQGGTPAGSQDMLIAIKQPIIQTTK
ncbi:spermatogenesis-associated protein 1-like [Octopus sinensis]|uniref:Spermatogenesis-associated protein 1-like n=1 Tax=Octopus sinensis TaxID=2607531 RepID=A0A7E6FUG4_9MOLL|nr:spermatogenesis-associated protein 1-like [Octopus sinensis]